MTGIINSAGSRSGVISTHELDYEEGFHTVTIATSSSGTVAIDASSDQLSYTKIGRLVTVTGGFIVAATGTSSPVGYFKISMPFATANETESSSRACGSIIVGDGASADSSEYGAVGYQNEAWCRVYLCDQTGLGADSAQQLASGSVHIFLTFSYFTV